MGDSFPGLPPEQFARAFPFHVAFDERLRTVSTGEALRRILPALQIGERLDEHLRFERPPIDMAFGAICEQQDSLFVLKALIGPLRLRGQVIEIPGARSAIFLGSPWVTDLQEIASLGLSLNDFATHDPVAEFLFLLQSKDTALDDARELNERLGAQRAELAETRGRLQHLLSSSPSVIFSIAVEEPPAITYVSENVCERLGHEPSAFLTHRDFWGEQVHPDDRSETRGRVERALGQGHSSCEYRFRCADGSYRWLREELSLVRDPGARTAELVGSWLDITQRREAEEARRVSEARLRAILDTAADGIITIDETGVVQSFNAAASQLFGRSSQEVVGRNVSLLMPSPDRERHSTYVARYLQTGQAKIIGRGREVEGLRSDGTKFPLYLAISDVSVGGHRRFTGILRDLTEQKRAEQELRDSEARLQMVIDNALDGVIATDSRGVITGWNAQATQIFGWKRDEVLGRRLAETLIPERYRERQRRGLARFLETGDSSVLNRRFEMSALRQDGEEFPVEIAVTPVWLADGVAFNAFVRDIGDRRQREQELRQAIDEAHSANEAKSRFLATISHEIRTPMNGVFGMVQLLLDSGLTPDQQNYAEKLKHAGELLLRMINDLLDFSKVEAGRLEFQSRDCDVRALVESALATFAKLAELKGLVLETLLDADLPARVRTDPHRVEQVLGNLLANALKFTETGRITVDVRIVERDTDSVVVRFEVTDTGPGIHPAERVKLFEPFVQIDASTTRQHGGSGLGLAICRQIVEGLGGEIGVESQPGEGSRFWFTARFGLAAESSISAPAQLLRGVRVLVIAEDAAQRGVLAGYLQSWGIESEGASDVEPAIGLLNEASERGQAFDVAVIDGPEDITPLVQELRAQVRATSLPLIVFERGAGEVVEDGVSVLRRSWAKSDLLDCLTDLMAGSPKSRAPRQTNGDFEAPVAGTPPMRILVAEDNEISREIVTLKLAKIGHDVSVVTNGREALEALGGSSYDLVLMDCQMPELDGYAATRAIRKMEGPDRRTPVIGVTANAMEGDREECLAAGMDDYIPKPVDFDVLVRTLQRWGPGASHRSTMRGGDPARRSPLTSLPNPVERELRSDESSVSAMLEPIDEARLVSNVSGDADILARLVRAFEASYRQDLECLAAAISTGDEAELRRGAHKLCGSLGDLAAAPASRAAQELGERARAGDTAGLRASYRRLDSEVERARRALMKIAERRGVETPAD